MEKKYYVYTYAYPDSMGGEVFYIGKGTGNRINVHETEARTGTGATNVRKIEVIRSIWEMGKQVVKRKIAFFEDELDAYMFEWAMAYMTCSSESLINSPYHNDGLKPHAIPKVVLEIDLGDEASDLLERLSERMWLKKEQVLEWAIRDFARQEKVI